MQLAHFGIAGFVAVSAPIGGVEQLLVRIGIAFLHQVAGLLPAEDAVGGHAPRGAFQMAAAHQELEKQRRHIEAPARVAVGEDLAEHRRAVLAAGEVLLVGRLVVRVARARASCPRRRPPSSP